MKIKNKNLIILGIVFFVMLLLTVKVNAADYASSPDYTYTGDDITVTGTIEDLGLGGTLTISTDSYDYESAEGTTEYVKYVDWYLKNVNQQLLNEYAKEAKSIVADMKVNIPSYITRVTDKEGNELAIEENNGQKYISYEQTIEYTNKSEETPIKEDVHFIFFDGFRMEPAEEENYYNEIYDNKELVCYYDDKSISIEVQAFLSIYSENEPCNYGYDITNKYGKTYDPYNGEGGWGWVSDADKYYLNTEEDANNGVEPGFRMTRYQLPSNINLAETYFELYVDVYQGETIEIEELGTLYYVGIEYKWDDMLVYIYKNTLDKLNQLEEIVQCKLKTATGYELIRAVWLTYELDETVIEEPVTGTMTTVVETEDIGVTISGTGNAEFDIAEYDKTDVIYKKLEDKLNEAIKDKYNAINTDIFEIYVETGVYQGSLELTFDVGAENNGKSYLIGHLKNGLEYEEFTGKVEDGKITITVDSLSPFMVSIVEEKAGANTDNGVGTTDKEQGKVETKEEDKTKAPGVLPETGLEITIVLAIAVMLVALTVAYNKSKKLRDI